MSSELDVVSNFSAKAGVYQQYRWSFDRQAIATLLARTAVPPGAVVADIGAGTGMSSRPFLEAGYTVFAVEPSAAMRQTAVKLWGGAADLHAVDGRAERTGLAGGSVDLIVAGRALHWFPPRPTREEFARISAPGGWLAVMAVKCADEALLDALRCTYRTEYGWNVQASKFNRKAKPLHYFFAGGAYEEIHERQVVHEQWPQFLGRVLSFSPAPHNDHAAYGRFEQKLREIFAAYQTEGELVIPTVTTIAYGHPALIED